MSDAVMAIHAEAFFATLGIVVVLVATGFLAWLVLDPEQEDRDS